eukprot:TRINITY_DN7882_c0_g2_i1.p1 TRINITY_DN7882_c0_g2~~TRINITY_DN7882_c0_g2_i1.p1  ORF type:complete len:358 (+),score=81.24 TRINITY_DN7882_c0_g2_i1:43-1116(+)
MALTNLLRCCEVACKEMTPMLTELYGMIGKGTAKEKADKSIFTVADGLVQCLVAEKLLGNTGVKIVGEEDATVQIQQSPFMVGDLTIPKEVEESITKITEKFDELKKTLLSDDNKTFSTLTAFIDPIDGTREFSTGLGEQCSICIGFAIEGKPVAGIVYRPLSNPPTWASGCLSEGYTSGNITQCKEPAPVGSHVLTSNGGISTFIENYMATKPAERVKSGGVGNKMLMLLEGGPKMCYFQDRGVSRWDTCAAQAILESRGGVLLKLSPLIASGATECYTYKESDVNLDFTPSEAVLSLYNCTDKSQAGEIATSASQVQPYANLAGLFALHTNDKETLESFVKIFQTLAKDTKPSYN